MSNNHLKVPETSRSRAVSTSTASAGSDSTLPISATAIWHHDDERFYLVAPAPYNMLFKDRWTRRMIGPYVKWQDICRHKDEKKLWYAYRGRDSDNGAWTAGVDDEIVIVGSEWVQRSHKEGYKLLQPHFSNATKLKMIARIQLAAKEKADKAQKRIEDVKKVETSDVKLVKKERPKLSSRKSSNRKNSFAPHLGKYTK